MNRILTLLLITLSLVGRGTASAADLANNLASSPFGGTVITDSSWEAQAFTTGLTDFVIDSITVRLRNSGASPTGTLNISIYTSTGSAPGSIVGTNVGTVDISTLTTSFVDHTFSGLSRTLAASTTYFLVLSGTSVANGDAQWGVTSSTSGTGFPSDRFNSSNGGNAWTGPNQTNPNIMRIVAVPEPSTYALGSLAAIAFGLVRKRRLSSI